MLIPLTSSNLILPPGPAQTVAENETERISINSHTVLNFINLLHRLINQLVDMTFFCMQLICQRLHDAKRLYF